MGRDLARARALNGVDTARVFALLAITMHDALQTSFSGKFIYGLWRPTTAIREADRDNNPATVADPTFVSLIPTPPYPELSGKHGLHWRLVFGALRSHLGPGRHPVLCYLDRDRTTGCHALVQWIPSGWRTKRRAAAFTRGIHYTFDHTASFGSCTQVANYAFDNYLSPR